MRPLGVHLVPGGISATLLPNPRRHFFTLDLARVGRIAWGDRAITWSARGAFGSRITFIGANGIRNRRFG